MSAGGCDYGDGVHLLVREEILVTVVRFRDSMICGELSGASGLAVGDRHQSRVRDALGQISRVYNPEPSEANHSDLQSHP
jgi:hypothetical protein